RYCSDGCRLKARRVSWAKATKKYKESLQACPDATVRAAAKAKHNAHQAASRARRKKTKRVRSSDSDRSDSGRKIESEEAAAPSRRAVSRAWPPEPATPAFVNGSRTRTNEASRTSGTGGRSAVCGIHGAVRWVVNVDTGICRSAWKRFEPQDDP